MSCCCLDENCCPCCVAPHIYVHVWGESATGPCRAGQAGRAGQYRVLEPPSSMKAPYQCFSFLHCFLPCHFCGRGGLWFSCSSLSPCIKRLHTVQQQCRPALVICNFSYYLFCALQLSPPGSAMKQISSRPGLCESLLKNCDRCIVTFIVFVLSIASSDVFAGAIIALVAVLELARSGIAAMSCVSLAVMAIRLWSLNKVSSCRVSGR